jgi:hypothetical protein
MIRNLIYLSIVLFFFTLVSCSSELTYEKMVNEGLESGIKQDSLFLGYYFGMGVQDFHSVSMEMNRQGILTGYTKINYKLEALKSNVNMVFYPTFEDNVIVRVPVTMGYEAWAPWHEHFQPQVLIQDLIEYYEDVYKTQFTNIYIPEIDRFAYVSIEGNREIRLYQNSPTTIMADFIDLTVYGTTRS